MLAVPTQYSAFVCTGLTSKDIKQIDTWITDQIETVFNNSLCVFYFEQWKCAQKCSPSLIQYPFQPTAKTLTAVDIRKSGMDYFIFKSVVGFLTNFLMRANTVRFWGSLYSLYLCHNILCYFYTKDLHETSGLLYCPRGRTVFC